ncbi:MAG: hypothetical protein IIA61_08720 [Candidatus Marinimicrobia bacterium]|nr:hypothetical protein [Candidatus Neomarinimicrobiota bacterium]
METRDKVMIVIVVAWIVAAVYFKVTTDNMSSRMDEMDQLIDKHVDEVNKEFRKDLRTLNLQFIGRGKHVRKAQKDIIENTNLIHHVTDSLSNKIETVQLNLDDYSRTADARFRNIEKDIETQIDRFKKYKRLTNREIGDLDQRLSTAEKDIEILEEIEKGRKKK